MRRSDEIDEIAQRLIRLYRDKAVKKKGRYQLSALQFKRIANRENLHHGLIYDVDAVLRKKGYVLITLGKKRPETIAMLSIKTLMKRFPALQDKVVEDYFRKEEEEADEKIRVIAEALTR